MDEDYTSRDENKEIKLFSSRSNIPEKKENHLIEDETDPIIKMEERREARRASGPQIEIFDFFERRASMRDSGLFKPNESAEIESEMESMKAAERILDSKVFQNTINFITVYVLFSDDFRSAALPVDVDLGFNIVTLLCMTLFLIEICMSVKWKEGYLWSFFFWLDLISSLTLIFDLTWIQEGLFFNEFTCCKFRQATNSTQLARASRMSRFGARVGRLLKLIRLAKIYKAVKTKETIAVNIANKRMSMIVSPAKRRQSMMRRPSQLIPKATKYQEIYRRESERTKERKRSSTRRMSEASLSMIDEEQDCEFNPDKESRVGKKLSELTTKRVIVLVLILVVLTPVFSSEYWKDPPLSYEIGVKMLQKFDETNAPKNKTEKLYNEYLDYNRNLKRYPLIYFQFSGFPTVQFQNPDELRNSEKKTFESSWGKNKSAKAIINFKEFTRNSSIINMVRTLYVCFILALGAMCFTNDVNNLALRPIERMIEKVEKIAKNPISSKEVNLIMRKDIQQYETLIIENAIIKIGTLLALGFGDAGSEIIAQNMAEDGDVNPMIMGKKTWAVFGFCDIRNFTDTTEILQEEVMVFVNTIAECVHRVIDKYGGSANKNIGDAFLLVWKVNNEEIRKRSNYQNEGKKTRKLKNICDLSLYSFLKTIIAINSKPKFLAYRKIEKLNERLPNYKINMGFGMHFGWAIEGAIGSVYKIDASYLSPNVNMASRLEAATKQFGVPLLLSGDIYSRLSRSVQRLCREIDKVTVKGSETPISLFTYDIDVTKIKPSPIKITEREMRKKYQKYAKAKISENYILGKASI